MSSVASGFSPSTMTDFFQQHFPIFYFVVNLSIVGLLKSAICRHASANIKIKMNLPQI